MPFDIPRDGCFEFIDQRTFCLRANSRSKSESYLIAECLMQYRFPFWFSTSTSAFLVPLRLSFPSFKQPLNSVLALFHHSIHSFLQALPASHCAGCILLACISKCPESDKRIYKEVLKEMSKVVTSLVRILSKFVHIEQGYVIKVCLVSNYYLFDYAHYFITSLGIFGRRNYYLCSHCNRNISFGGICYLQQDFISDETPITMITYCVAFACTRSPHRRLLWNVVITAIALPKPTSSSNPAIPARQPHKA
jgi:hypothetical protein